MADNLAHLRSLLAKQSPEQNESGDAPLPAPKLTWRRNARIIVGLLILCVFLAGSPKVHCLVLGLVLRAGPDHYKIWAMGILRDYGEDAEEELLAACFSDNEEVAECARSYLPAGAGGRRRWLDKSVSTAQGQELCRGLQLADNLGHQLPLDLLKRLSSHPELRIRVLAIQCLRVHRSKEARAFSLTFLKDPSPQIREALGESFGNFSGDHDELMLRMLQSSTQAYQRGALMYFDNRLVEKQKPVDRKQLTGALVGILCGAEGERAQDMLITERSLDAVLDAHEVYLASGDYASQQAVMELLESIARNQGGTPRGVSPTQRQRMVTMARLMLQHCRVTIRVRAAAVLTELGVNSDPILEVLIDGLASPLMRSKAATTLGVLGANGTPALEALKKARRVSTEMDRWFIDEALDEIESAQTEATTNAGG